MVVPWLYHGKTIVCHGILRSGKYHIALLTLCLTVKPQVARVIWQRPHRTVGESGPHLMQCFLGPQQSGGA